MSTRAQLHPDKDYTYLDMPPIHIAVKGAIIERISISSLCFTLEQIFLCHFLFPFKQWALSGTGKTQEQLHNLPKASPAKEVSLCLLKHRKSGRLSWPAESSVLWAQVYNQID